MTFIILTSLSKKKKKSFWQNPFILRFLHWDRCMKIFCETVSAVGSRSFVSVVIHRASCKSMNIPKFNRAEIDKSDSMGHSFGLFFHLSHIYDALLLLLNVFFTAYSWDVFACLVIIIPREQSRHYLALYSRTRYYRRFRMNWNEWPSSLFFLPFPFFALKEICFHPKCIT